MIIENKIFSFLGDSITEGRSASSSEKRYFEVFGIKYNAKKVIGYGISGTRIARQVHPTGNPMDQDFISRVDNMDEDSDFVIVFGGTNDYGHGDAPIGNFLDRTDDTFYGCCHALMSKLINKYVGKTIVFMTPLHRKDEYSTRREKKGFDGCPLITYVDAIKEVARYYSIPVCEPFLKK